jgi:D-proline reductase (dithiol) PrdB
LQSRWKLTLCDDNHDHNGAFFSIHTDRGDWKTGLATQGDPHSASSFEPDEVTPMRAAANTVLARAFTRFPFLGRVWSKFARVPTSTDAPWTEMRKSLDQSRVCLITTAGLHLKGDKPFNMGDRDGDPTYRAIPVTARQHELTITHDYYDHRDADRDMNIVFPLDRLRELTAARYLGGLTSMHYSFMGHIDGRHVEALQREVLPALLRSLDADAPDFVFLTPA